MDIVKYRRQTKLAAKKAKTKSDHKRATLLGYGSKSIGRAVARSKRAESTESDAERAIGVATDPTVTPRRRAETLHTFGSDILRSGALIEQVLEIVIDPHQPTLVREEGLRLLQVGDFSALEFEPYRPQYRSSLRNLIDDENPRIQTQALRILAQHGDDFAQQRIVEGLTGKRETALPTDQALVLLGSDVHADAVPVLQRIVKEKSGNNRTRRVAVSLLGSHEGSKNVLARVYQDRKDDPAVRIQSAISLQSVDPGRFQKLAKKIAVDETENSAVRATSLRVLADSAEPASYATASFTKAVQSTRGHTRRAELRQAADHLLARAIE